MCEQYVAAAEAYLRGIERRLAAGLDPNVASVASLFVSRWDVAVAGRVPAALDHRLERMLQVRSLGRRPIARLHGSVDHNAHRADDAARSSGAAQYGLDQVGGGPFPVGSRDSDY